MIWIILLFGLILRLISINQSFWLDEATSATVVRDFSLSDIVTKFAPYDFHPPLYYLVLKALTSVFGVSEVSARLLSILFGILTVSVVYKLGLLITNHKSLITGQLAALFLATSPLHIYYSQEARMYSMEAFLTSLTLLSFVKMLGKARVEWWIVYGISIAALGMTDYLPLLMIPVFTVGAFLSKKKLSWWVKFITSHIMLIISYIWWWPIFTQQLSGGLGVATSLPGWWNILGRTSINEILLVPVKFMIGRVGFENKIIYGFIVAIFSLLFGYLLYKAKNFRKNLLMWLWLIIPIFLAAMIGLRVSVFSYFRLIFVLPAFYILVAVGLSKVSEKYFPLLLIAVLGINLIFSSIYLLNPKFHREDWRGLVSFIKEESKDKNYAVMFPGSGQQEAFKYYGGKVTNKDAVSDKYDNILLVRYIVEVVDLEDSTRKKVESLGYNKTLEKDFNGVLVWKYQK